MYLDNFLSKSLTYWLATSDSAEIDLVIETVDVPAVSKNDWVVVSYNKKEYPGEVVDVKQHEYQVRAW